MDAGETPAPTVLVVEDSVLASAGMVALLGHSGYMVTATSNGRLAGEILDAGPPPDAILLDMWLPEVDGWDFLEWLKDTPHRAIPVIIATGTDVTPEWAAAHGCAGFLKKPLGPDDVLLELRRVLRAT
ncbi:MAG TPA: response regulator [Gemmataceae bacterium]|jgi:CheY-like chemotaxis protein